MTRYSKVIRTTILLRRDTLTNWELKNPVLQAGEIGFVTDINKFKIGNGVQQWIQLPWYAPESNDDTGVGVIIKTEQQWETAGTQISKKGVLYIYTDNIKKQIESPLIKIGDGTSYICDLPFAAGDTAIQLKSHVDDYNAHISEQDRENWNKKVTAYIYEDENQDGVLVLDDGTLLLN